MLKLALEMMSLHSTNGTTGQCFLKEMLPYKVRNSVNLFLERGPPVNQTLIDNILGNGLLRR